MRVEQHPDLGAILVDSSGNTLYLFTDDERGVSNCYQGCAAAWPPLLTAGDPIAGEGVQAGRIDIITRADGSTQVTYNGWPLYRFAADERPNSIMGQNVGGMFFAVSIYGGPIQSDALVKVSRHPDLGDILVDASGRTLYLFTVDERGQSNCLGGCARAWPPLITIGEPLGDEGASVGRLSTVTREDGYLQVSYNGWPLYYFAPDRKPGDARGQDSGVIWFVVSSFGGPIQTNAVVKTSDHPDYSTILTDASGRTLYLFTDDERDVSNCTRGCSLAWPPLLTVGQPSAEERVDSRLLGITTRDDGSSQVTYNGWPLYYFAPDQRPGDAMGQYAGDVWFVVSTSGEAIAVAVPTPTMDHPPAAPTQAPVAAASVPAPAQTPVAAASVPTPTQTAVAGASVPAPTQAPVAAASAPTPTTLPAPAVAKSPAPVAPPPVFVALELQEVAFIEDYAASRFYPGIVIVVKDVPLKLYITRLRSEHVNEFHIRPFLQSTSFDPPGTLAVQRFTPDESGEFVMHNVGHGHEGKFVVVDSLDDADSIRAEAGVQKFALIHNLEKGTITPNRLLVRQGIPVRIYNISLGGNDTVSIEPFYTSESEQDNVTKGRVTTFEFMPTVAGEFVIRYDRHETTGTLIVR